MQGPQGHPNISPRRRPDKRGGQEEERLIRLRQHKQEVRLRSRCPSPIVPEWVQEPHVHQGGQPPSILRGRSGGRRQFFDTRYIAILRRNGESLGENPVGSSPTPRAEGNLCAFEMALKNCNLEARGSDGPIVFMHPPSTIHGSAPCTLTAASTATNTTEGSIDEIIIIVRFFVIVVVVVF